MRSSVAASFDAGGCSETLGGHADAQTICVRRLAEHERYAEAAVFRDARSIQEAVGFNKDHVAPSLLVVLGARRDGEKVLLSIKNMGGESEAGWRGVLDDLVARGLRTPDFLMVGGCGLMCQQRCTVHKHRNLLAHRPARRAW